MEYGSRQFALVLLRECQSAQQVITAAGDITLGKALQKDLRAPRILIEERCCGGQQQNAAIARPCAYRHLSLRQKPTVTIRISEGGQEDILPSFCAVVPIAPRHLFRRIAERQYRLCRGSTRHARPATSSANGVNESTTQSTQAYRGPMGIQARHATRSQHTAALETLD